MRRMKRFMAFTLSAAMMLATVNMPEVTAWAQDTGKGDILFNMECCKKYCG